MTQDNRLESNSKIQKYVSQNDLRNDRGNIQFFAEISFKTTNNSNVIFNSIVRIDFNGYEGAYGKLDLLSNTINSNLFPTSFSGYFQTYEIDGNGNLCISGYHENPKIGNYYIVIRIIHRHANLWDYE